MRLENILQNLEMYPITTYKVEIFNASIKTPSKKSRLPCSFRVRKHRYWFIIKSLNIMCMLPHLQKCSRQHNAHYLKVQRYIHLSLQYRQIVKKHVSRNSSCKQMQIPGLQSNLRIFPSLLLILRDSFFKKNWDSLHAKDHRSKESIPQAENSRAQLCEERNCVNIDILVASRNGEKKIVQSIRITSRPSSRRRQWNQLSQFRRTSTTVIPTEKT